MMTNKTADAQESFVIPSRTLRGSRQEMLQDIDQAIVGLLALRHLIGAGGSPHPALASRSGGKSVLHRAREWFGHLPAKLNGRPVRHGNPEMS
jgi:hypothetical protein